MKLYIGSITSTGPTVKVLEVDGPELSTRKCARKLPTCYNKRHVQHDAVLGWGTCRGYAAQLSYALIYDAVNGFAHDPAAVATRLHHRFKSQVISRLPRNVPWAMCEETVRAACDRIVTESMY